MEGQWNGGGHLTTDSSPSEEVHMQRVLFTYEQQMLHDRRVQHTLREKLDKLEHGIELLRSDPRAAQAGSANSDELQQERQQWRQQQVDIALHSAQQSGGGAHTLPTSRSHRTGGGGGGSGGGNNTGAPNSTSSSKQHAQHAQDQEQHGGAHSHHHQQQQQPASGSAAAAQSAQSEMDMSSEIIYLKECLSQAYVEKARATELAQKYANKVETLEYLNMQLQQQVIHKMSDGGVLVKPVVHASPFDGEVDLKKLNMRRLKAFLFVLTLASAFCEWRYWPAKRQKEELARQMAAARRIQRKWVLRALYKENTVVSWTTMMTTTMNMKVEYEDKSQYKGEFKFGKRAGHGVMKWPPEPGQKSGDRFMGQFAGGEISGHGVFVWADGRTYAGQCHNGLQHGLGRCVFSNGEKYTGRFKNGEFCGYGFFESANGSRTEGTWKHGRLEKAIPLKGVFDFSCIEPHIQNAERANHTAKLISKTSIINYKLV